ncbi:MAG: MBL fold metallo-hydrolase [Ktedonobacterales bacterium]
MSIIYQEDKKRTMHISSLSDSTGDLTPRVNCIPTGLLEANCYLVVCPQTAEALLIDPGADPDRILEQIKATGCRITRILHTHGHFDHISATESILAGLEKPVPVAAHAADAYLYVREARARGARYSYPVPDILAVPNQYLSDGDQVEVGNLQLEVIHTPGHTPGSISLICGTTCVFTGDTLFRHAVGRTDLVGGDEEAIYESILTRLYPLAESLTVFPGHGPETSIGEEKQANPFVQAR